MEANFLSFISPRDCDRISFDVDLPGRINILLSKRLLVIAYLPIGVNKAAGEINITLVHNGFSFDQMPHYPNTYHPYIIFSFGIDAEVTFGRESVKTYEQTLRTIWCLIRSIDRARVTSDPAAWHTVHGLQRPSRQW